MCGRLNTTDDPALHKVLSKLGLPHWQSSAKAFRHQRFVRATDKISIIREKDGQRKVEDAIWWLLLDQTELGFKPSKYTSFNTRHDKLNKPRAAGYEPFRMARCIILAKGFGETELVNKRPQHYWDFEALEGQVIAFGGLYKEWLHPITGDVFLSCSIITLPAHDKLQHIHSKSMPLILPQQDNTLNLWLDSSLTDVEVFSSLLTPNLYQDLIAYPIDKPSRCNQIGNALIIPQDTA